MDELFGEYPSNYITALLLIPFEIAYSLPQPLNVIGKTAETPIAVLTQQPSNFSCLMIVVDS
jgi:hypothetical protein